MHSTTQPNTDQLIVSNKQARQGVAKPKRGQFMQRLIAPLTAVDYYARLLPRSRLAVVLYEQNVQNHCIHSHVALSEKYSLVWNFE